MVLLDGKKLSLQREGDLKPQVMLFEEENKFPPHLAVIIVEGNPASEVYVAHKHKACTRVGFKSSEVRLPNDVTQEDLIKAIKKANNDPSLHALLVQLPLPAHLKHFDPSLYISPLKDVDGLTATNAGLALSNQAYAEACTPSGVIELLKAYDISMEGKLALVIGRSRIVGWPMAQMLVRENATVTVAHSRTKNLPALCKQADIIVAAAGVPEMIKGDWIKKDAVVVDVGIHRKETGELVGDVEFESVSRQAAFVSPVPGGVGPMTINLLLFNTLKLAQFLVSNGANK